MEPLTNSERSSSGDTSSSSNSAAEAATVTPAASAAAAVESTSMASAGDAFETHVQVDEGVLATSAPLPIEKLEHVMRLVRTPRHPS